MRRIVIIIVLLLLAIPLPAGAIYPLDSTDSDGIDDVDLAQIRQELPSFFTLPPEFEDDGKRPVSYAGIRTRVDCTQDLRQLLQIDCITGQLTEPITIVTFAAGGFGGNLTPPYWTPGGPNKKPTRAQEIVRLLIKTGQVGAAIGGTGVTAVLVECLINRDEETYCTALRDGISIKPAQSLIAWVSGQAAANRVQNLAYRLAEDGATAIVVVNGWKRIYVYHPGLEQPELEQIDADAETYYNRSEGRTYVPLRAVNQAAGARVSAPLGPDGSVLPTITDPASGRVLRFPVDQPFYTIDGAEIKMESGQTYIDPLTNRTMVPVRYALAELGYLAVWYPEAQAAILAKR